MRHTFSPTAFDPQQQMLMPQVEIRYCADTSSPAVGIHSHTHYELYFFCEGSLDRYVVGAKSYRLQPGDLLCIPPMTMHHPVFREDSGQYRRYVLWFHQEYLSQLVERDPDIAYAFRLCRERGEFLLRFPTPSASQRLEGVLQAMWAESQSGFFCRDTAIRLECMDFLVQLNRCVSADGIVGSIPQGEDPLLEQAIAYVHSHYGEPLTLEEMARRFYVSPSTMEHLFTQKLGWPFYRYVTKRRIIEAQLQIANGVPVKTVFRNCGYHDYSIFYKMFTKEVGMSPSQYRSLVKQHALQTLFE